MAGIRRPCSTKASVAPIPINLRTPKGLVRNALEDRRRGSTDSSANPVRSVMNRGVAAKKATDAIRALWTRSRTRRETLLASNAPQDRRPMGTKGAHFAFDLRSNG